MGYAIRVEPGSRVDLSSIDWNANGGLTREDGEAMFTELAVELGDLQDLFYAAQGQSHLTVFQGLDTSGKDGAIRNVFKEVDPQGCRVSSFKVPSATELAHDFLWRVHAQTPERGIFGIFNRSHYEDVLVVRVHDIVPKSVWERRYEHINAFELFLAESDTLINKFYLHISKEEQEKRLIARELEVQKAWKLSSGDWIERQYWDKYIVAYEEALARCSTVHAPWYVIPAGRKWFRNLAIAEVLVEQLRPSREAWLKDLTVRGEAERIEIEKVRAAAKVSKHEAN